MFPNFPNFRDLDAEQRDFIGPSSQPPQLLPGYTIQVIVPGPSDSGLPLRRISDAWWLVAYNGTDVNSYRDESGTWVLQRQLFQDTRGITSLDMSFDQLGRELVCYEALGIIHLYWFDPIAQDNVVTPLTGGTSATIGFDFPLNTSVSESDVTLIYSRLDTLYIRLQRDRFTVEYESNLSGDDLRVISSNRNIDQRYQLNYSIRVAGTSDPIDSCPLSIEFSQRFNLNNSNFIQPLSSSSYLVGFDDVLRIYGNLAFTNILASIQSNHTSDCAIISSDSSNVIFTTCSESLNTVATYNYDIVSSSIQLVGTHDVGFPVTGLTFSTHLYFMVLVYGTQIIIRGDINVQGEVSGLGTFYSLPTDVPLGDFHGLSIFNNELIFSVIGRMFHLNITRFNLCGPLLGDQTPTNTTLKNISVFNQQLWVSEGDSIAVYNIIQET